MKFPNQQPIAGPGQSRFDEFKISEQQRRPARRPPTGAIRIIGASCGAFVFGFVAIMISVIGMEQMGERNATIFWGSSLVLGALGGFAFPRFGHLLGYSFLFFMNVMLSMTIGRDVREQLMLFLIFAFIESIFFLTRHVLRSSGA